MNDFSGDSDIEQCSTRPQCSTTEFDNKLVTICCDEYGEYVPVDNWNEHTDYHVAMQIQTSHHPLELCCLLKQSNVNLGLLTKEMRWFLREQNWQILKEIIQPSK